MGASPILLLVLWKLKRTPIEDQVRVKQLQTATTRLLVRIRAPILGSVTDFVPPFATETPKEQKNILQDAIIA